MMGAEPLWWHEQGNDILVTNAAALPADVLEEDLLR